MTTYDKIYAFLTRLRLDEDHNLEWETDENNQIVIWVEDEVTPRCDVCNAVDEDVEWCGSCGCCLEHCQNYEGCDEYREFLETGELK